MDTEKVADHIEQMAFELKTISLNISSINNEQKRTNGRIGKLEEWQSAFLLNESFQRGVVSGRSGMALSKKQMTGITSAAGALIAAASMIGGIIVKFT